MTSPSGQTFRLASIAGSLLAVSIGGILYYRHGKAKSVQEAVIKPPKDDQPELGAKPVSESAVDVSYRVTADMVDEHGRMFAGEILKLIDIVAGVASRRHAETGVVTISLDRFILVQEVKVGDVLHVSAAVNRAWTSSMETGVRVMRENARTGRQQYCCHAYLTFVALARSPEGHSGPPASIRLPGRKVERPIIRPKVKKVLPATLIEKKRYLLAGHRRELRLAAGKKRNGGSPSKRLGGRRIDIPTSISEHSMLFADSPAAPLHSIPIEETYASTLHIVMPQHANSNGVLFGGQLMDTEWMEKTALLSAQRLKREECSWTTAGMDGLEFREAVAIGDVLTFRAVVTKTWRSSIEVYVSSHADIPGSETPSSSSRFTNECFISLVALSQITATALPLNTEVVLPPDSPAEAVSVAADWRKAERLSMKDLLVTLYAKADS
ncbi:Acyl-coenzyme A thioesterase 12 [Tulasnella sp. 417]|nr:Acyl-coenzyme A thioesterase 12 [Tulasnella sp. 417]